MKNNNNYHIRTIEEITNAMQTYAPLNSMHKKGLQNAYDFAQAAHEGQFKKSGETFFAHSAEVAYIAITEHKVGLNSAKAALLHDIIENTTYTAQDLKSLFGNFTSNLVIGLTKTPNSEKVTKEEAQLSTYKNLLRASAQDIQVLQLKLAERTHNLSTLNKLPNPEQKASIALETIELYIPLAKTIGLNKTAQEMEEICYKELISNLDNSNFELPENSQSEEENKLTVNKNWFMGLASTANKTSSSTELMQLIEKETEPTKLKNINKENSNSIAAKSIIIEASKSFLSAQK